MGLLLALAIAGCGRASLGARAQADREARAAAAAQSRELLEALDALEARLHTGRANLKLWAELSDRHHHVSALACENAEMHARGLEAAARKNATSEALGRRVAAARGGVVSDAHVSGYKTTTSAGGAAATPAKMLP